jgi:hypothetical protein
MEPNLRDIVTGNNDDGKFVVDISNAEKGRRGTNPLRRISTIGVKTVKDEVARVLEGEDPELRALVLKHVESIDISGDSRINPAEMAKFTVACVKDAIEAGKKIRWLFNGLLLTVPLLVLLALSTFGATTASVLLTKDVFVDETVEERPSSRRTTSPYR